MFRNYLKIALRTLWRRKIFSLINICGLAIGIATCLIILLFIQHETSYDKHNKNAADIVRVAFHGTIQGEKMNESNVMAPVAGALKANFPEIIEATRLRDYGTPRLTVNDKLFNNQQFAFVDSNFFRVFTLPLIAGNQNTALIEPNTIIISKAASKQFFGNEDPIGKLITMKDQNVAFKITGLFDEVPENSHFHFDFFASLSGFPDARGDSWMESNFYTYLQLKKGTDYRKLDAKLTSVVDKYLGPQLEKAMGMSMPQFRKAGNNVGLYLQPLTDIHLYSDFNYDLSTPGNIKFVYIFGAIAGFMLLIACINFMNLSTAGASRRAREVGIRKVMGSMKGQLVRQFLIESLLLSFFATLLALVFVYLALPVFNALSGKQLALDFAQNPSFIIGLVIVALITGLLAGSYPAFFLSSFNPIAVLKGKIKSGGSTLTLRSGLVILQFIISITLIVGTTVVYRQLSYMQHMELGYDKDQVVIIESSYWLGNNQAAYRQKLLTDPRISSISFSNYMPAGPSYNNNFLTYPDDNSAKLVKALRYDVDYDYISTLGLKMASGRNFSKDFGSDTAAIIVNETAARALGWGDQAVGHQLTHPENEGSKTVFQVVGVVKDFHFKSLHERISPLVMVYQKEAGNMVVKLKSRDVAGVINLMKKDWNEFKAEAPFSYSFLDERIDRAYKSESTMGTVLFIFAGLTILVACLGLFGLATFTAEQRTKEIGIRKVLGASVAGITTMLSRNFLKLVGISFFIAVPISWFVMNRWLEEFAYRINLSIWIFLWAGTLAIFVTVITVSFKAIQAALANPINSLKE